MSPSNVPYAPLQQQPSSSRVYPPSPPLSQGSGSSLRGARTKRNEGFDGDDEAEEEDDGPGFGDEDDYEFDNGGEAMHLRALEFSGSKTGPSLGKTRSYSISGFDFQHDLIPLSSTLDDVGDGGGIGGGEKNVSLLNGIALVVGLQIGSGIFSSPGVVIANTHTVGASLLTWLCSGLLGWTGASSFAELGSAIPLNGGAQAYLAYAYTPLVSYLFAWTAITALKPGSNGVIALIFAEYVARILAGSRDDGMAKIGDGMEVDGVPQWVIKSIASSAIILVTLLCIGTKKLGTRTAVVLTTIKVLSILLISCLGLIQLARGRASSSFSGPLFEGSSTSPSSYALALYSGLWAFDGWDQANYVGGEMTNPERNIPRAIHTSMITVLFLFLSANASYFIVLPTHVVASSNTVALDFGRALFGSVGGALFAGLVAISCFGALNGSFFTSARLIYCASREGYLPPLFGRLNKRLGTPVNAMLLQAGVTLIFVVFGGGFRSLINFAVVASWAFYFMTVLGLLILRVKEPDLPRPYKTWLITPVTFCAVALFLLCMPVIAAPLEALAVLGFVLAGVPVYYLTRWRTRTLAAAANGGGSMRGGGLGIKTPFDMCFERFGLGAQKEKGWIRVPVDGDE